MSVRESQVPSVDNDELVRAIAVSALDAANMSARRGLTHDGATAAFTAARAALARIVDLTEPDGARW